MRIDIVYKNGEKMAVGNIKRVIYNFNGLGGVHVEAQGGWGDIFLCRSDIKEFLVHAGDDDEMRRM